MMDRLPRRVPSLDDFCTSVVASVTESLTDTEDEISVTDIPLLREVSGTESTSVKVSPDLDLRFLAPITFPLRLILTGSPSWTRINCCSLTVLWRGTV